MTKRLWLWCIAVGAVASLAFTGGASVPATSHVAPAGGTPHLAVGSVGSFVTPSLRRGTPTCPSRDGTEHVCYSPSHIREAYDYPTGRKAPTGAGQTIAVIVAFGSPTIEEDLEAFEAAFEVPPATLTILGPNGSGDQSDPNVLGWGVETSFGVEWAHAMAPGAQIVLSVAASDDTNDILAAVAAALGAYPKAILVQSWGIDENDPDPAAQEFIADLHALYESSGADSTLVSSTGDFGATDGTDTIVASYPASDPLVLAVGGTQGKPYPEGLWRHGKYGKESAWNESREDTFYAATGGAPSILFPAPSWQRPFSHNAARTVPDVSYNASIDGGMLVYYGPFVFTFGGTSAGPPQWAGIIALANELRARNGSPPLGNGAAAALYRIAGEKKDDKHDFHDIKDGNNILVDQTLGFEAGPGYDLATGLGSPDVDNLIADLARAKSPK